MSSPSRPRFPRDLLFCARVALSICILLSVWTNAGAAPDAGALRVYFVDVEGGQATLFITPQGESLLVDTGWPGNDGRDAQRIAAAARDAGLKKIDYVLVTHFHVDHVGGASQLAAAFPVGTFIDHGDNRETGDERTLEVWKSYQELLRSGKYKRLSVKAGDVLPIRGMRTEVVSSDGAVIQAPLPGAGQANPACKGLEKYPADTTENPRSVGMLITFGGRRILNLADLTRDKEVELMCPNNKLGKVDIYIVSHHGWRESGSPALVHGIAPKVAIMDNGARKGGSPEAWDVVAKSPGLQDFWQLHFSEEGGKQRNAQPELIANPEGPDSGHYLKLTVQPDGAFAVFNSRTQRSKTYAAR